MFNSEWKSKASQRLDPVFLLCFKGKAWEFMALLNRREIVSGLERLGQLASQHGQTLQLVVMGGAAMVLGHDTRQSTHDVDALIVAPKEAGLVREWVKVVALEKAWPDDWLNDAAKGYLVGMTPGPTVLQASGIEVRILAVEQLLAMKLSAWRDDVDIQDAASLLKKMEASRERGAIWESVLPFLVEGLKLKAQYAFDDLWESVHGSD